MAYEIPTPKYLRVLNALRGRIEDGTYAPGAGLPSESQLCTEFAVSRPTVLKALGILKQDGWIESQQGRGSFVRGRPPPDGSSPQYARDAVDLDETAETEILHVGPVLASPRIAAALEIPEGTPVYERRRRTVSPSGPIDLVSTYIPVDIAVGTDVAKPDPIAGSILDHIASRKSLRADYATERLTARQVDASEVDALGVSREECVAEMRLAIAFHLDGLREAGEPIPEQTAVGVDLIQAA